jgi:predicted flavoprotein YhiN
LTQRLAAPRGKQSMSSYLRKAGGLAPVVIGLMHETALATQTPLARITPNQLAELMKAIPVRLTGVAPLARAISTAGGVAFAEIDANFMLKRKPGVFVAGEMLDWEAPTGGYLLQGAFATGVAAARGALAYLQRARP